MVHTLPDYSTKYKMVRIFGQIDTGELAVRLKSIVTNDRRGNVMWMDDFEDISQKWDYNEYPITGLCAHTSKYSYSGTQCMQINSGAHSAAVSGIDKRFPQPPQAKFGIECFVRHLGADCNFGLAITARDGNYAYDGDVRYYPDEDELKIRTGLTDYTSLGTGILPISDEELWYSFKIVIDWATKKYVRAIVGYTQYDLSKYSLFTYGIVERPYLKLRLRLFSENDDNHTCYVDNVIITQNEP